MDVLRATSVMAVLFGRGLRAAWLAGSIEDGRALRATLGERPGGLMLCGEVNALPPEGFDYGNSPLEFERLATQAARDRRRVGALAAERLDVDDAAQARLARGAHGGARAGDAQERRLDERPAQGPARLVVEPEQARRPLRVQGQAGLVEVLLTNPPELVRGPGVVGHQPVMKPSPSTTCSSMPKSWQ